MRPILISYPVSRNRETKENQEQEQEEEQKPRCKIDLSDAAKTLARRMGLVRVSCEPHPPYFFGIS